MLTKTCWRRTRVLLVMIFANDFAHRRNIVAGGEGGGILVYFSPSRSRGGKAISHKTSRDCVFDAPMASPYADLQSPSFEKLLLCGGSWVCDSRLFFPRRPSSRAKKNSLIAPNGTGARPKTSRIGHALSHEELFSHTFNPSWNAVLDFEKLRLRSLAPDSDHTPINKNAYQTPIRHPSDTYQTPIRRLSDTYFLLQKRKCGFTRDFEQ